MNLPHLHVIYDDFYKGTEVVGWLTFSSLLLTFIFLSITEICMYKFILYKVFSVFYSKMETLITFSVSTKTGQIRFTFLTRLKY